MNFSMLISTFGKVTQTSLRNSRPETRNSWLSACPRPSHPHTHTHTHTHPHTHTHTLTTHTKCSRTRNIRLTHAWLLCYSLLGHWWMGKWVCLHSNTHLSTHTHTQHSSWFGPRIQSPTNKAIKTRESVHMLHDKTFPKTPMGRISKYVLQMYEYELRSACHYRSFPVSAFDFAQPREIHKSKKRSTLMHFCVTT